MKTLNKLKLPAIIVTHVMIFIIGAMVVASTIFIDNKNYFNTKYNLVKVEMTQDPNVDPNDPTYQYFKSDFNSVTEVEENGAKYAYEVVKEGAVLLENKNNALPLAKGSRVSLFSASSVVPVYCGTGSGASSTEDQIDFKTGFELNGNMVVNPVLWNWYNANNHLYGRMRFNPGGSGTGGSTAMSNTNRISYIEGVLDANWAQIDTPAKTDGSYGDAAIFVLARKSGEGADVAIEGGMGQTTNGNVLELGPREIDVLKNLKLEKDKGTFDRIIVLMNSASQVQCDFMSVAEYGIDALVWCGAFGDQGPVAIGDLLVGEENFSGKLSDTFFTKHAYNPVYANWIPQSYTGVTLDSNSALNTNANSNNYYVVYQEGIYNGYRYTEYEDVVMGRAKTGVFDYDEVVSYPFGYGESYSEFTYSGFEATYNASTDTYTVRVTVTNTGDMVGKEVVQVYLQKPYTPYDISYGVEKAAVELVGFAKTGLLGKGDNEPVTIEIPGNYFASYDSNEARTFILDAGDYYLTAAKDSHSAVNNILALKNKTTSHGMTENGDRNFVYTRNIAAFDDTKYATSAVTKQPITNQFDNADLNKYSGSTTSVTYLSRSDWEGTIKFGYSVSGDTRTKLNNSVRVTGTQKMKDDAAKPTVQKSDDNYPTYREEKDEDGNETESTLSLIDLLSVVEGKYENINTQTVVTPYNDPKWDELLDNLSWNDTVKLLSTGFRSTQGISSINKPNTLDPNGPNGLVGHEEVTQYNMEEDEDLEEGQVSLNRGLAVKNNDPKKTRSAAGYPCNGLVASTFNKQLARDFGKAWGEDCLWAGVSGLYGTAVNMHRGVYNGRTFEYFSEDSILSGQMAAGVTLGLRDKGVYSYLKHAVLNDSEAARKGSSTWINEQTIREIYLRPFQIAIEDGKGECIMTGYNRIGVLWTGHQGFLNTVFRNEYGMTGFVVSDYFNTNYMTVPVGIMNGNDLPDNAGSIGDDLNNYAPGTGYGEFAWEMRESAKRILFTVVQSNAMNGITTGTRIKYIDPTWPQVLEASTIAVSIVGSVFILACITVLVVIEILRPKER